MNNQVNITIELLGKPYAMRCSEEEVEALQKAAAFLNAHMQEVRESGKAINLERIAIMAALMIAFKLQQLDEQKISLVDKINHRISQLQDKLDMAINQSLQTELAYTAE